MLPASGVLLILLPCSKGTGKGTENRVNIEGEVVPMGNVIPVRPRTCAIEKILIRAMNHSCTQNRERKGTGHEKGKM